MRAMNATYNAVRGRADNRTDKYTLSAIEKIRQDAEREAALAQPINLLKGNREDNEAHDVTKNEAHNVTKKE